ncbi:hypothetical protein ABI59_17030 [Acidobacteria bacterium Mor1]|nr:hypothetical protein ABI59_17030 [Acidobacteria bacterium Mor1]
MTTNIKSRVNAVARLSLALLIISAVPLARPAYGQSSGLGRPIDIVTLKGHQVSGLIGKEVDRIDLYRWDSAAGVFTPIPFQIDEIEEWDLLETLGAFPSECSVDPGSVDVGSLCETNYAFDFATGTYGSGSDGDDPAFDADDEIVFAARDAGDKALVTDWVSGADTTTRVEIALSRLSDSENPTVEAQAWVYAYVFPTSHTPGATEEYVSWTPQLIDPERTGEPCFTLDFNVQRGQRACGWATSGYRARPTLELHWIGNNSMNRMKVRQPNSSLGADLLDREKFRIPTPNEVTKESEESWDSKNCPRVHGLKTPAENHAPIRVLRQTQGTQSGFGTTRNDWYYGTHHVFRYRLRVHQGVPPLMHYFEFLKFDTTAGESGKVTGAAGMDTVDGSSGSVPGQYNEAGPTHWGWSQIESSRGNFAWFVREPRPFVWSDGPSYFYSDASTVNTPPELEDGRYGANGTEWQGESMDMQDRVCSLTGLPDYDPDDPGKLWKELELVIVPLATNESAMTVLSWLENPLVTVGRSQSPPSGGGLPSSPCGPNLSQSNDGSGYHAQISLGLGTGSGCDPNTAYGYRIYRALGLGEFLPIADVAVGSDFPDSSVRPGNTYRYKAYAYDETGAIGPPSNMVTVTISDAQAPDPPENIVTTPLSGGGNVVWESTTWDTVGFNIKASIQPGGPYTKLNGQTLPMTASNWTITGLTPGVTYYLVMESIDNEGNISIESLEASLTPLP